MPRDRQRAKQRQAARRAERLAGSHGSPDAEHDSLPQGGLDRDVLGQSGAGARTSRPEDGIDRQELSEHELEELADFEVGAPPQDVGFSETVIDSPVPAPHFEGDDEDGAERSGGRGPRGVRGRHDHHEARHGRLVAFLIAVWAELGRVQWPDRKQLTQLTGVVLFFVIVVGAYLGALDAVFSKIVNAIL